MPPASPPLVPDKWKYEDTVNEGLVIGGGALGFFLLKESDI